MTQHPLQMVRDNAVPFPASIKAKHPLGELDSSRHAKHLMVYRPTFDQIDQIVALAQKNIPGVTTCDVVRRVFQHNADCLWCISRTKKFQADAPVAEGFIAMLPLNKEGLRLLAQNQFNALSPDPQYMAATGEKPAGIYIWATYAPGLLAGGVSLFMNEMAKPPHDGVNLYTRPNTDDGVRFNEALGLTKSPTIDGVTAAHLYKFNRDPAPVPPIADPIYDSHVANAPKGKLSVAVVRSLDDMMRITAIRSTVYMAEQHCPYEEEFDGNDTTATHLIGYVGNEPAGCIRIRYFADFAKIERVAVRSEFRKTRISFRMIKAAIELCRMKGYRRLYGHARSDLQEYWTYFGFQRFEGGRELVFSDTGFVEMIAEFDAHPDAIRIGTDPYKILRPEGRWHIPGILEISAARSVSNNAYLK